VSDLLDFELEKAREASARPGGGTGAWLAVAVAMVAAGIGAYYLFGRRAADPASDSASRALSSTPSTSAPLGGVATRIAVPPLGDTDALVRELVTQLSSHPTVAAWLATDGLIRNFAAAVSNLADGRTPARQLTRLAPSGRFEVQERGGQAFIEPRSYLRYNAVADAVASLDAAGCASLYATLKPRIEEAYSELGTDSRLDSAMEWTIVTLLRTPVLEGPVALEPEGIGYAFADSRLEDLTPAQKQLLRMGPRNVRMIQSKLREIGVALGIPPDRLPEARGVTR
jgi:Protein of unknown function (DUF3014)